MSGGSSAQDELFKTGCDLRPAADFGGSRRREVMKPTNEKRAKGDNSLRMAGQYALPYIRQVDAFLAAIRPVLSYRSSIGMRPGRYPAVRGGKRLRVGAPNLQPLPGTRLRTGAASGPPQRHARPSRLIEAHGLKTPDIGVSTAEGRAHAVRSAFLA